MRRNIFLSFMAASAFLLAVLLGGCGSAKKEGAADPLASTTKVGSASCTNVCHAATRDLTEDPATGPTIVAKWLGTTHTSVAGVQCEDCHGGGSLHRGIGPIPFPTPPAAQCAQASCHPVISGSTTPALADFNITRHANTNQIPDSSFSQIPTPVPAGKHVEECSRCHNVNQRFEFDFAGNMVKPDLNNLATPGVACASCHDGHQPQQRANIAQRAASVGYPVFRKFMVDLTTGQQVNQGVRLAATIFQPDGAAFPAAGTAAGTATTPDFNKVIGRNNELNPDMLCAPCHTKGTYKNSGLATHQDDIHTQWAGSGHGDRNAAAFAEFAANPPAYINEATGQAFAIGDHRTTYPIDMALTTTGATATTTRNASYIPAGSTRFVNNYQCFKCHNGLTSLAYQDDVQGTPAALVVFGDVTVTCITCHDPHKDAPGNRKNTRKPVAMTHYSSPIRTTNLTTNVTVGSLKFTGNVFLDNTPVPAATGNETICVFCHQGRESGFTLFKLRLAADNTLAGAAFLNEHYLGTGSMLWGRNAYEYSTKQYGEVAAHQQANCDNCHMVQSGRNDLGGHSWRVFAEADGAVNNASCNVAACHSGRVPATKAGLDSFRDTVFDPTNDYDGDGLIEGIPGEIRDLSLQLILLLQANGIEYDDNNYPYFFQAGLAHISANGFVAWTLPTLKAAFNLQYVIKGLPSAAPVSQIGQPNPSAATHNYRYNIQILRDAYDDLQANGVAGQPNRSAQPRPAGTRPAANYDPQPGGGYNPRQ
ncbi:MAG: hypothetical protein FD174_3239 [Geobacteraceae bacterium]|nr:MAG: hypothetical protein FD174_3239 [Geobacteraceae bacterium]